ncbi:MAG: Solute-binding protein Bpro [Anaerocolumna sp.]|nr:Solute-binding protein Bpro [Anaerocolumna sp.]
MKKIMSIVLTITLVMGLFVGCGKKTDVASTTDTTAATQGNSAETTAIEQKDASSEETIVLRLADTQNETYPATMGALKFASLVEGKTNGRIKIEVFTGGQLGGDEQAIIEQVQFGAIDLTRVNLAPMCEFSPMLNLLQMPYLFRDVEHMHKVIDSEIGTQLLSSVEDSNFVGLALYDAGTRNFYNSIKPITKLEDMKGMKLRVTQSQLMVSLVESLGATPTPMAFGEVYSSLQTGVIDGAENNWVSYDQNSHHEVAKYITVDGHTAPPEILICSKLVFDKLSPEDQQILVEAAKESEIWERETYVEIEKEAMEKTIAAGAQVSELENRDEFVEAVKPIYEEFAADYTDLLEQIQNMQ